jgi:hypothetical protein
MLKGQFHEKVYEFMNMDGSSGLNYGSLTEFFIFFNRPFKSYDFPKRGAHDVKPVSWICKMLLQTTALYSGSGKILQRQTLH